MHPVDGDRTLASGTTSGLAWMFLNAGGLAWFLSLSFGLDAATIVTSTPFEILVDCGIGAVPIQRSQITTEHIRAVLKMSVARMAAA